MGKNNNKQNYGLLDSLFSSPAQRAVVLSENTKKSPTTQRTWKIKDELWNDFTALVATSGMTQAEFVNKLIEDAILQNRERIDKFLEIMKK